MTSHGQVSVKQDKTWTEFSTLKVAVCMKCSYICFDTKLPILVSKAGPQIALRLSPIRHHATNSEPTILEAVSSIFLANVSTSLENVSTSMNKMLILNFDYSI